jgi:hypothetical protein
MTRMLRNRSEFALSSRVFVGDEHSDDSVAEETIRRPKSFSYRKLNEEWSDDMTESKSTGVCVCDDGNRKLTPSYFMLKKKPTKPTFVCDVQDIKTFKISQLLVRKLRFMDLLHGQLLLLHLVGLRIKRVLFLCNDTACHIALFIAWAYLPDHILHRFDVYYYPNRFVSICDCCCDAIVVD